MLGQYGPVSLLFGAALWLFHRMGMRLLEVWRELRAVELEVRRAEAQARALEEVEQRRLLEEQQILLRRILQRLEMGE